MNVDDAIAALRAALGGDEAKKRAAGVGKRYELRFVGDARRFTLDLTTASVSEGAADGACGLGIVADDVPDLLAKRTTMSALFSAGRLRVFGNVGDAMKLASVFE